MASLVDAVRERVVVLDGGLATELERRGNDLSSVLWSARLLRDDPDEIVGYLLYLRRHPEEQERIRSEGCRTAEQFLWDQVIENLVGKLEFLARKQNIVLT